MRSLQVYAIFSLGLFFFPGDQQMGLQPWTIVSCYQFWQLYFASQISKPFSLVLQL
jgi:hypothetical protein